MLSIHEVAFDYTRNTQHWYAVEFREEQMDLEVIFKSTVSQCPSSTSQKYGTRLRRERLGLKHLKIW